MSDNQLKDMPFIEHLRELRSRLIKVAFSVLIFSMVSYFFATDILYYLTLPFKLYFKDSTLIGTKPGDAFYVQLQLIVFGGLILSLPYSFFQFWSFISPGLHDSEKKHIIPFVFFATILFLFGALFAYFKVLPIVYEFFSGEYKNIGTVPTIILGDYLSLTIQFLLLFGIVFEIPLISIILGKIGILTSKWMKETFRYATVIIFILAAIFSPPDVVSQMLLAIPLLLLWGISILLVSFIENKDIKDSSVTTKSDKTLVIGSENNNKYTQIYN